VHDVFLLGQRFRELDLVVVEQGFVGDDDQGDGDAEGVEDGAGACVCVESVSEWMCVYVLCFRLVKGNRYVSF
jgi:hypothetical protein